MAKSSRPPANGFVAAMRKVYNPIGFSKGYNFILSFCTIGYLLGFTLARLQYLSFHGIFCNPKVHGANTAVPGECFIYQHNPQKLGIMVHLFCILPAAILACAQFVPVIRHKFIIVHRINGYIVILLSFVADAGLFIFLRHSFGGDLATQTMAGTAVIMTTVAYVMAYVNIKLLQIDQHRAWMIRAWVYFSFIVTIRLIMIIGANLIGIMGSYFTARPCAQIDFIIGQNRTMHSYPACEAFYNGTNTLQQVVIHAEMQGTAAEKAAALGLNFGAAGWLALWIHAVAVEVYLRLTPAEAERLKQVSYERQLARGSKRPGFAGLVPERFGDANPYVPLRSQSDAQHESGARKESRPSSDDGELSRSGM